ncbi:MAG: C25 family peptidase propeptide domain-containing protein [Caldilineaceae bacterium]
MRYIPQPHALPRWLVSILLAGGLMSCFVRAIWHSPNAQAAQAPASTAAHIDVIRSDAQTVELEFHLGSYSLTDVESAGAPYQQLLAEGMAQTAAADFPQAPTLGAMIGIPTTAGVRVEVMDADVVELTGIRLPPAPQYVVESSALGGAPAANLVEKFDIQPAWAGNDDWLPNAVVTVGQTGALAGQPVAQIQFTPVQYNPARQRLKLYSRIRARITWTQNASTSQVITSRPAPATVLDTVLANQAAVRAGYMTPPINAAAVAAPPTLAALAYEKLAKVSVAADGLYKITYDDLKAKLSAADMAKLQDPTRLALYNHSSQAAIEIQPATVVTAPWDAILFYGAQIRDNSKLPGGQPDPCGDFNAARPDHWYTETNVYWLVLLPAGDAGLRMNTVDGTPNGGAPPAAAFREVRHFEVDEFYWQTLPGQNCEDRWFWGQRPSNIDDANAGIEKARFCPRLE